MALRTQQPVDAADNPILDDEVYEPITAFGCGHPDGYWASFGPSVRVRGYEVKRLPCPQFFLPTGTPSMEIIRARNKTFPNSPA